MLSVKHDEKALIYGRLAIGAERAHDCSPAVASVVPCPLSPFRELMTAPTPVSPLPLVCIHGYSSSSDAFKTWKQLVRSSDQQPRDIHIGNYVSLSNEITIKDIAEGLDRALRIEAGLQSEEPFDAIVHSTGMLVIRSWLATYPKRRSRLRHLIGLAPATWGSPLAHDGRGFLGSVFKGNKNIGPDFLEAGDLVLDGLELGSRFTWDLAHLDLFGAEPFYGKGTGTPFVFIFCGNRAYKNILRKPINKPGTDGTVRWSGTSLNSRKISVNLTRNVGDNQRAVIGRWNDVSNVPLIFVDDRDHGSIMDSPPSATVDLVRRALTVTDDNSLAAWCALAQPQSDLVRPSVIWQQFVIHVVDERGDPVPDYGLTLFAQRDGQAASILHDFEMEVHPYARDHSYRNFHVNLSQLIGATQQDPNPAPPFKQLVMELTLTSGTKLVGYRGMNSAGLNPGPSEVGEILVDLTPLLRAKDPQGKDFSLFHAFTTTLVEIIVDREPLPVDGRNQVYTFENG
jgi:pimeloyl-ACP methyl ester carboxylesterase